jgi:response regulator RpfG family c-di-GMP phosphodiesterase
VELLRNIRHRHPLSIRLLFTGFADLEAIIEAINHGHIFKFVKKPWQPDDLLSVVREAAQEYDRLVKQDEELAHLRAELERLRQRVTVLEQEVARLRGDKS